MASMAAMTSSGTPLVLVKGLPGTECMMTKVSRMIINMAISIMPSRFRINLAIPLPPLRQSAAAAGPRFTGAAL